MIEHVLTACNENPDYLFYIPYFVKCWKHLFPEVKIVIVMIMKEIPEDLKEYSEHMILFEPIEGMHTAYTAQNIRIYYPSLLNSKGCLITDIDLFPSSKNYYISGYTPKMLEDSFITFRPMKAGIVDEHQIAICYNIASSEVWQKINECHTVQDICSNLIENYSPDYGEPNPPPLDWFKKGWFKDQELLFDMVLTKGINQKGLNHHVIGDGDFKRLDKSMDFTLEKARQTNPKIYSDFIPPRKDYPDWQEVIRIITNKIVD